MNERKHTRHDDISWGKVIVWLLLLATTSIIAALWHTDAFHAVLLSLRA